MREVILEVFGTVAYWNMPTDEVLHVTNYYMFRKTRTERTYTRLFWKIFIREYSSNIFEERLKDVRDTRRAP